MEEALTAWIEELTAWIEELRGSHVKVTSN